MFVQLMAGDNDDQLQWPFVGDIVLELLNWRRNGIENFQKIVSIDDACKFYQVTEGTVRISVGFTKFFPQSSLSYNSTTNTQYLQNDCLRLRVSKVAVYSSLYLNKVPSWQQDPHNVQSQSVCEFTLSEFSKRKECNNSFYSPPFYTHQHGYYKLCICIYSNSQGGGKNTHISVYVCIIAGEYDDQLQWPFVGDAVIELLNWKENKKHHQTTVSVEANCGFVQVLEGTYGTSRGYSKFISHSSLSYNSTTNTEYLYRMIACDSEYP